jgi:hypothetical protein
VAPNIPLSREKCREKQGRDEARKKTESVPGIKRQGERQT